MLLMAKKLLITLEKLKRSEKPKMRLVNFRIEEDLYYAFEKFCHNKLKKRMSKIVRTMIKELCIQNGCWKE